MSKEPDSAATSIHLGNALQTQGRFDEAMAHYTNALRLEPDNAAAHGNLGNVLKARGQLTEAIAHYRKALAIEPDNAGACNNLANALQSQGEFHDAIAHYRKALAIDGGNAVVYNNLGGAILCEQGSLDDAVACFERALALKPDYTDAHCNLGNVFRVLGRLEPAAAHYEKAIALRPDRADLPYILGNVFSEQGRLDSARACYEQALALRPDFADAHTNLIVTLMDAGKLDDALFRCERALACNPDSADAHLCEAHLRLLSGDFANGWRQYEWRWLVKEAQPHGLTSPMWNGQPLRGRTILLHCEQGLGDSIQFVRYARLLKDKDAKVLLSCPPSLAPLFRDVDGIEKIVPAGHIPPGHDFHAPLMSLPGLFRTTLDSIPAGVPYLRSDPARARIWQDRLHGYSGFRVGIAWRGNRTYQNDHNRSMTAAQFTEFLSIPGLVVVSLQKDGTPDEMEDLGKLPGPFFNAAPLEEGLADAASLMANLDLTITVDTSLCHLAGALGLPVWTLIPFTPDWRWLLQREDSPWYPTMRLFRQAGFADWQSVLARVRAELAQIKGCSGAA